MLPPVVLLRIGDFLPDGSLANLACTNRRLQEWLTPSLYDRLIITIHPQLANPADPRDYLLLQAVCNGSLQATRFYLSLGANPNTVDSSSQSWSLLQNAIVAEPVWRAVELVRLLLRAGADMGFVAGDGMLAVHVAAQRGGVEVLRVVLKEMRKRGLGVGTRSFGEAGTAVHFAAGAGRLQALRMLISEWGADPREKDQDGEAPLIWAGRTGERECLEFLRRQLGVEAEEEKSQSRAGNWVGIADVIPNKSCLKRPKGKKEKKERW